MDPRRPLLLIHDQHLLEQVLRLAAAAGCEVGHARDGATARAEWPAAPVILLDETGAAECVDAGLPRRSGVFVLCLGQPPPTIWQRALEVGADRMLALPEAESVLAGELADVVERPAHPGRVLAVLGGRGGAGASVFAAALAVHAVRAGEHALLVDCDPLGGGLDLVLGAEESAGLRWPELALTGGRIAAASLHAALPQPEHCAGRLTLLSCDRTGNGPDADAVRTVVAAGKRAGDTVVCDLSRQLDDTGIAVLDQVDLVLLVVPAEVRACASANRVAAAVRDRGVPMSVVVRGPAPGGLGPDDVSRAVELPLAAYMPAEPGLDQALDRGRLPIRSRGPLASAARSVLRQLAGSNAVESR